MDSIGRGREASGAEGRNCRHRKFPVQNGVDAAASAGAQGRALEEHEGKSINCNNKRSPLKRYRG